MKVAIVGTGISGTTLALRLQQLGVDTTLYTDRTPDEQRAGRLENLVARFAPALERDRLLGVDAWSSIPGAASHGVELSVAGTPVAFRGIVERPVRAVDLRLYLSRLVEIYAERGGRVVVGPLPASAAAMTATTAGHDVAVVAAGRSSRAVDEMFPVRADRSPYRRPQRHLLGGLCTGLDQHDPPLVTFRIVPGAGEIFSQPVVTTTGVVAGFLIEAIPGGPLDAVARMPLDDLDAVASALLTTFEEVAPSIAERVDRRSFALLGERDVLAGGITPTVRTMHARLGDGRPALAVGDAWIVNDPIIGQGANTGSHCAWALAQALASTPALDDDFGRRMEEELWSFAGPVTALSNAFLQPPPDHALELLGAATADPAVATAFAAGFADPVRLAHALSTPTGTRALIAAAREPVGV